MRYTTCNAINYRKNQMNEVVKMCLGLISLVMWCASLSFFSWWFSAKMENSGHDGFLMFITGMAIYIIVSLAILAAVSFDY